MQEDEASDSLDFDQATQEGAVFFYKSPKLWDVGAATFVLCWTSNVNSVAGLLMEPKNAAHTE